MKPIKVRVRELFKGEGRAGLPPEQWMGMSEEDRLYARVEFIRERAGALAGMPYSDELNIPGNVWGEFLNLEQLALQVLTDLDNGQPLRAAMASIDVGRQVEHIKTQLAIYAAADATFKLQKPRSAGGVARAEISKDEQAEKIEQVVAMWRDLGEAGRPERERAGIIATRKGWKVDTVRRWLRKAGLR